MIFGNETPFPCHIINYQLLHQVQKLCMSTRCTELITSGSPPAFSFASRAKKCSFEAAPFLVFFFLCVSRKLLNSLKQQEKGDNLEWAEQAV